MSPIFEYFFGQYAEYETYQIVLEIVAVLFGIISAWCSKRNSIWVYPTGIVSTSIFVYLLWQWELLGDMLINVYYFTMSVYGWYVWTRKVSPNSYTPITWATKREHAISLGIFFGAIVFVYVVYELFEKWTSWTAYVDTLTTGLFFVGMWLLARRKVENWLYLLAGNIISVPLYFYKGYTISSMLYVIFVIISVLGYFAWKKNLHKDTVIA
ncbi:MAG: nicotinamide riboside transporter PnuC [Flavobacteriales bacterium]|uniref:nicotinamide riboside transporter PnuC n=1 Tax=Candidatus Ulvibacter alkanivorans TaxID=2267620 RepID=UPI000DF2B05B|nr:nicotinamide riboside transporter PnuC [Candidatus Ulvibacter alkanivorans]MCH2490120.1 nicotinamide riboside transporter PnuC [Flavobacteriales bacterium]